MYVCICNGITEEMLESAMGQTPNTKDVLKKLGVGSSCGICLIDAIEKINSDKIAKNAQVMPTTNNQK